MHLSYLPHTLLCKTVTTISRAHGSFTQALGEEGARMVDINTVDGFQGREKDIILFSCVR